LKLKAVKNCPSPATVCGRQIKAGREFKTTAVSGKNLLESSGPGINLQNKKGKYGAGDAGRESKR
jgi:hypothetical protein